MSIKFAAARFTEQEALLFHSQGKPGKLEITPTKPLTTQRDLSLAYSPGVAVPVLAIAKDPAPRLRLHQQGQPGGRGLQRHGDPRPRQSRRAGGQAGDGGQGRAVQALRRHRRHRHPGRHARTSTRSSTACAIWARASAASTWRTSRRRTASSSRRSCKELLDIPVFHDDQHGTAIIAAAGLLNALELTGRDIADFKLVVNGAGAASIACMELLVAMGMPKKQHAPVRHQGRHLPRPQGRHEPVEVGLRRRDQGALAGRRAEGRRRLLRPLGRRHGDARRW